MIIQYLATDEEREEIREKGRESNGLAWYFGNKVNELYARLPWVKGSILRGEYRLHPKIEARILTCGKTAVCDEVADEAGRSRRTIRDYADVAAHYDPLIVALFDCLPFAHFRFAKQYPAYTLQILGVSFREYVKRDMRAKSVAWLKLQFKFLLLDDQPGVENDVMNQVEAGQHVESVVAGEYLQGAFEELQTVESYLAPATFEMLREKDRIFAYLRKAVEKWEQIGDRRFELCQKLSEIEKEIEELTKKTGTPEGGRRIGEIDFIKN